MSSSIKIAPSILAANFLNLKADLDRLAEADIEWLHYDVMDGHFVPNISFGASILHQIKKNYSFFYDVHIMVSNPLVAAVPLVEAGADLITFHLEAVSDVPKTIDDFRAYFPNTKLGISIKPNTPVETLLPFLSKIDLVLVMSVEPGQGGQKFMLEALDKIEQLREYIDEGNLNCFLEVDGGINSATGPDAILAGADVLVAGTYIFKSPDVKEAIAGLFPCEE